MSAAVDIGLAPMLPRPARITRVVKETADTFTLHLEPPDGKLAFMPGQFNMLYVFGVGEVPISISGDPDAPEVLVHTIRAVGAVTKALMAMVPGDVVGVRGPYGNAWPVGDVAVHQALGLAGKSAASARQAAEQRAQAWRPWRSYGVIRAWASLKNPAMKATSYHGSMVIMRGASGLELSCTTRRSSNLCQQAVREKYLSFMLAVSWREFCSQSGYHNTSPDLRSASTTIALFRPAVLEHCGELGVELPHGGVEFVASLHQRIENAETTRQALASKFLITRRVRIPGRPPERDRRVSLVVQRLRIALFEIQCDFEVT